MAIFKCKMCGGVLDIKAGQSIIECDYCSTVQTLPRLDTERRAQLYDRANHHLRNNEYDKAMGMYESILNEDSTDAEAYWSIVLCRFGISYVKDPNSGKYFLTVNRMLKTSIKTDADFKAALNYADEEQKAIYAQEAAKILAIQQKFDAIYKEEEPFDVFISYKETDENGKRTHDSVLAYDLYHQLTQEGFKVFFSRVTLEHILGTEYEPYIFAALNSAKVMVVLGTKPEHFNAVWVKNEWSRYLALIHNGEQKVLIPAYKDMDPYDMPDEFQHLQAQDMSKLGFMQDLIRGINKILGKDKPQASQAASSSTGATTDSILKRAFMFLDDSDWQKAEEYCERVLDIDPENAMAYVGKLMADLKVNRLEFLGKYSEPFNNNNNYRNAIRFADAKLRSKLTGYNDQIAERNSLAATELKYAEAVKFFSEAQKTTNSSSERKKDLRKARDIFRQIPNHKDANELRVKCEEQIQLISDTEVYDEAMKLFNGTTAEGVIEAKVRFESVKGFKNADEMAAKCDEQAEFVAKNQVYERAESLNNGASHQIEEAIRLYGTIEDFKDSKEKIEICKQRFTKVKADEEAAIKEKERQTRAEYNKKQMKKRMRAAKKASIVVAILSVPVFIVLLFTVILPKSKFNKAVDLFEAKEYEQSYEILCEYDNKIAGEELFEIKYKLAEEFESSEDYFKACVMYDQSNGLKDSKNKSEAMWKKVSDSWEGKADRESVAVSGNCSIALKNDGTVVAAGDSSNNACDVSGWTDIVSVAISSCSIGLKSDGTVITTSTSNKDLAKVAEWKYIVAIYAESNIVVGLRGDGTVITNASGKLGKVDDWKDIVSISLNSSVILGLKSDGTVVAAGKNKNGECDVQGWSDIIQIETNGIISVGLKKDGTVVVAGDNRLLNEISDIDDAVYVDVYSQDDIIVLRKNGKLVSTSTDYRADFAADWSNLKKIYQYGFVIFGVTHDGYVGVAEYEGEYENEAGDWKNIDELYIEDSFIIGRKTDGSFVSVSYSEFIGNGPNPASEVEDWTDIRIYD